MSNDETMMETIAETACALVDRLEAQVDEFMDIEGTLAALGMDPGGRPFNLPPAPSGPVN